MSRKDDVIVVNTIVPGAYEALKEEFPDADIRKVHLGESTPQDISRFFSCHVTDDEVAQMQEADILVAHPYILAQVIYDLPNIKWVQLTTAGADRLLSGIKQEKPFPTYSVTRNVSKDIGKIMAEYVIGQVICHERSWYSTMQNQQMKVYGRSSKYSLFRSLPLLTVGILGVGAMGQQIAESLKHFGSRVHGYSRRPKEGSERSPFVDDYWHSSQLPEFLATCDYIVSVLPSTPETRGFLGKDVLKHAKKCPVLMNVGRGDLISENDVIKALDAGWISTAILDVFEKEPLPTESALWSHPQVVITPHVSGYGSTEVRGRSVVECFKENYQRYVKNQPLIACFDWKTGY